jgi:hypothetical protein
MAHDVVNRPYFDYRHTVGLSEGQMTKLFAYYSFMKNNVKYWNDVTFNPELARRAKAVREASQSDDDVAIDKSNLSDYMKDKRLRVTGSNDGDQRVTVYKSDSSADYATNVREVQNLVREFVFRNEDLDNKQVLNTFLSRLQPFYKNAASAITGKDLTRGYDISPDRYNDARLADHWFLTDVIDGMISDGSLIKYEDGKPVTDSGFLKRIDKAFEGLNMVPFMRGVEKTYREYSDKDNRNLDEAFMNVFGPITTTEVKRSSINKTKRKKIKEKANQYRLKRQAGN